MSEVFKEFVDKAPDIIGKAVQSPLGLAALSVLVLGIVGVLLFRKATGKLKLVAFAMITSGFLGFMALVFIFASNPKPPLIPVPSGKIDPDKTALGKQSKTYRSESPECSRTK